MTTTDLDDQLTALAAPLEAPAAAEARRMASETMPSRMRRGRAPRSRWALPLIIGGAIALTAGAGTTTIVMSHWGGVEMPMGNVRNSTPIPVTWTTESGHLEKCRVWIELRNPQPGDATRLDQSITGRDWSGLGQRLYDEADPEADDPDGESRVGEALTVEVQSLAAEAFPGIVWFGAGDERAVDAWGMTCAPEAE